MKPSVRTRLRMVRATGGLRAGEPSNHWPFKLRMLDLARILWTLALAALILALLITRCYRSLPVFSAYLLATALQAAFHWRNLDFAGTWWINWAIALSAFRAATVAETFWLRAVGMRHRLPWLMGLSGMAAGATFLAGRVRPDRPWIETTMVFRHFEAGLLALLLMGIGVTAILSHGIERWLKVHSWLLAGLILSRLAGLIWYEHLPVGFTEDDWDRVQTLTYLGAAVCYCGRGVTLSGWKKRLWASS